MHRRPELLRLRTAYDSLVRHINDWVAGRIQAPIGRWTQGTIDRRVAELSAQRDANVAQRARIRELQAAEHLQAERAAALPFETGVAASNLPQLGRTVIESRPAGHIPFMVSPAPISNLTTVTSSMPTLLPIDISGVTGGIGGAIGGDTGRALGGVIGSIANTFLNPQQSTSTGPTPVMGMASVAGAGPMVMAGGAMVTAARALLIKASMFVGKRVTLPAVLALIRRFGPTVAATALGLGLGEIIQLWIAGSGKTRRRRGISGADLRRTTRTLRTLGRLNQLVGGFCGRGTGRRAVRVRRR